MTKLQGVAYHDITQCYLPPDRSEDNLS